jgi:hypothetical protein
MSYEYFYSDNTTKGIKKLKANPGFISKEFKSIKDVTGIATADSFSINPEETLIKVFDILNN